jgi:hypothetical protein
MNGFLQRHAEQVTGMLSGFDRVRFRGTALLLANVAGLAAVLSHLSVLLKDFGSVAERWSQNLRTASMAAALEAGRPVRYLPSSRTCKEELALQIAREDRIDRGLICVLTAVEPCMSLHVRRDRASRHLVLEPAMRKCLHLYHYFMHEQLGFCHVRVQSWLPFNIHVCVNGREMLGRAMDQAKMSYERSDNCFRRVSDVSKAQALLSGQLDMEWPSILQRLMDQAHPARRTMLGGWIPEYYWSMQESEWASDVMFKDRARLSRIYPKLIRHGMIGLGCADVMRYLGKRVGPENRRFGGEVTSDLRERGEGMRIKHRLNSNSIKMYDKQGSVLRVETTMNDPSDFKVYRRAGDDPKSKLDWRLLRKGVVDIKRRAEVCQAANERYLEALASVETSAALGELAGPLCRRVAGKSKGERVRGLNPLNGDDAQLLQAVSRGEFAINGFRNRDIRALLHGESTDEKQTKRHSSAVTRKIRILRAHGLVNKVSRTHRYVLSHKGCQSIAAILAARSANASKLLNAA